MRKWGFRLLVLMCVALARMLQAQSSNPVQYFYDDLGRLTRAVNPSGNIGCS